MKALAWGGWLIVIAALSGYFGYRLVGDSSAMPEAVAPLLDKRMFLIGEATHGHHQIELACGSCHSDPFGGGEVLQKACAKLLREDDQKLERKARRSTVERPLRNPHWRSERRLEADRRLWIFLLRIARF